MRRKRSLTLLEVIIAMVLLGIMLTGLFNCFRQGLKKNITAKELKQKVLQLELFQQKLKSLFVVQDKVWIQKHADASGCALMLSYELKADPEPQMCGDCLGMLYLNNHKELCFVTWSEKGKARVELLLDKVDSFTCRLFDPKKTEWVDSWPKKKEETPRMASIELKWGGEKIPFKFFLNTADEKITYPGKP